MFFFVWYINLDRSFYRFVTIYACGGQTDPRTDRRTDRILIARPRLYSMQRGKNAPQVTRKTGQNDQMYGPLTRWFRSTKLINVGPGYYWGG